MSETKRKVAPKPRRGIQRDFFGSSDRADRKIQSALVELDKVAADMERRWGVDRLRELVSPELRERFDETLDRLNAAIGLSDVGGVEKHAAAMGRGWLALENAAKASGARELDGRHWEAALPDGRVLCVAETREEAYKVSLDRPGCVVLSVPEIAALFSIWDGKGLVTEALVAFPGAEIVEAREKVELNDEIPF
jgi:hypothetical protein